jgi:hypothetical protein
MTAGIVSTTGRDIQAPNDLTIPNAIQTDATINHGNSGGPLLDASGRVVGVNAQIQSGTGDANVGIGFAIVGNTAQSVAGQLNATGRSEHAWLGIVIGTIDPSVGKIVQGRPERGVLVVRVVKRSPAAKAGLVAARQRVTVGGIGAFVGGDAKEKHYNPTSGCSANGRSTGARPRAGSSFTAQARSSKACTATTSGSRRKTSSVSVKSSSGPAVREVLGVDIREKEPQFFEIASLLPVAPPVRGPSEDRPVSPGMTNLRLEPTRWTSALRGPYGTSP